jgi:Protein of unknown function (DUF2934)
MAPPLDIVRIDPDGRVLWCGAVESLVAAKARIQKLALSSPGEYLILDQDTGNRVLVMLLGVSTQSQRRRVGLKESVSRAGLAPNAHGSSFQQSSCLWALLKRRAYEIYLRGGGVDGSDVADWIMAEEELKATLKESPNVQPK